MPYFLSHSNSSSFIFYVPSACFLTLCFLYPLCALSSYLSLFSPFIFFSIGRTRSNIFFAGKVSYAVRFKLLLWVFHWWTCFNKAWSKSKHSLSTHISSILFLSAFLVFALSHSSHFVLSLRKTAKIPYPSVTFSSILTFRRDEGSRLILFYSAFNCFDS